MLDNEDIQKLMEVLATKDDIKEIKEDVNGLREMVQALVISVDKFVGSVEALSQEYTMVIAKVDRHEKWLLQITEKLGLKLEY